MTENLTDHGSDYKTLCDDQLKGTEIAMDLDVAQAPEVLKSNITNSSSGEIHIKS